MVKILRMAVHIEFTFDDPVLGAVDDDSIAGPLDLGTIIPLEGHE
jgi:hypothetical protein